MSTGLTKSESRITMSEGLLTASICRDSFFDFVQTFWDTVVPEEPTWNWHIEYICNEMQKVAERVFRGQTRKEDLVINVPPGTSKSTICSIMFPAWVWTRMLSARCLCLSYSYPLAMELSRKSRDVVESDKYQACFPDVKLRSDQNTKGEFVNTKGGMRYAAGVGGTVMGKHAHFIIIDDPLDPNRAASDLELLSTNRWMNDTLPTRKVNKLVSVTILIMQRLHQGDPTGEWLERDPPPRHVCLPERESDEVKPPEVRKMYRAQGGLLDPVRMPEIVLEDFRKILGEYGYSCQFRQNPIPKGGAMFDVSKLTIARPPDKFKAIGRFWDKAGTKGAGAFTVGSKMGLDFDGYFWVLDIVRVQLETHSREQLILRTARADGIKVIIGLEQEPASGGKESMENTRRKLAGYRIKVDKPGQSEGSKINRAEPLADQVNGGNVRLAHGGWNREFLSEFAFFPYSKYKDQVDATSGVFNMIARPRLRAGTILPRAQLQPRG